MSVIMTLRVSGDPKKMEELAESDPDRIAGISARAKEFGLIAHRFYGSDNGEVMAVDEWPDAESFQKFWDDQAAQIGPVMEQVATGEPQITFWRRLETHDEVGWE